MFDIDICMGMNIFLDGSILEKRRVYKFFRSGVLSRYRNYFFGWFKDNLVFNDVKRDFCYEEI